MKLLSRLAQSRPLYEGFKALKEGSSWEELPEARKRLVEHELRDFALGGVALDVSGFWLASCTYHCALPSLQPTQTYLHLLLAIKAGRLHRAVATCSSNV